MKVFPDHTACSRHIGVVAMSLVVLLHCACWASTPTHRYSFDLNADDSIGGAHGILISNAVVTNGVLLLPDNEAALLELPGNLFTNSSSLTLEAWFELTANPGARRIWYGTGSQTMEYSPGDYVLFTVPVTGVSAGGAYDEQRVHCPQTRKPGSYHLVWAQDHLTQTARVYLNGAVLGENTSFTAVPGLMSFFYLGGRQPGGHIFGSFSEFRVYSNAVSHFEVLQSMSLGPEALPVDGAFPTNLVFGSLPVMRVGTLSELHVSAELSDQNVVEISVLPDLVLASSDDRVIEITADRWLKAVNGGTAEILASYAGISVTGSVTVVEPHFALAHRYDFSQGAVTNQVEDLISGSNGVLFGEALYTGNGQVEVNSGGMGYIELPEGILSSLGEVTIEAWVTHSNIVGLFYPRIFDFGNSDGLVGGHYMYLTPTGAGNFIKFAVTTNSLDGETPQLLVATDVGPGDDMHYAVSYSHDQGVSKLYTNGVLAASGSARTHLVDIVDTNNWLGRSQWLQDDYFDGLFDEFRVYHRVLSDQEIALNHALGPDLVGIDFRLRARRDGANLTLYYGPSAASNVVQAAASAGLGAGWTNVTESSVLTNGEFRVVVPLDGGPRFFRLGPGE